MKRPLLIATVSAALAAATLSIQASACDPIPGALIGGGIGAAIGNAPGAAVGAIIGSAITAGAPCYSYGRPYPEREYVGRGYVDRGYAEREYVDRRYVDRGYADDRYYERSYYAPEPVYYAPPPVYYAPAVYYGSYRPYSYPRYVSYGYRSYGHDYRRDHRRHDGHDRWR